MTKPDWAERLQRSRKREYNKGIQAEQTRIINLLKLYINEWEKVGLHKGADLLTLVIELIEMEQK